MNRLKELKFCFHTGFKFLIRSHAVSVLTLVALELGGAGLARARGENNTFLGTASFVVAVFGIFMFWWTRLVSAMVSVIVILIWDDERRAVQTILVTVTAALMGWFEYSRCQNHVQLSDHEFAVFAGFVAFLTHLWGLRERDP